MLEDNNNSWVSRIQDFCYTFVTHLMLTGWRCEKSSLQKRLAPSFPVEFSVDNERLSEFRAQSCSHKVWQRKILHFCVFNVCTMIRAGLLATVKNGFNSSKSFERLRRHLQLENCCSIPVLNCILTFFFERRSSSPGVFFRRRLHTAS